MGSDKMLIQHIILIPFSKPSLEKPQKQEYVWIKTIQKNTIQISQKTEGFCLGVSRKLQLGGLGCSTCEEAWGPFTSTRCWVDIFYDRRPGKAVKGLTLPLLTQQPPQFYGLGQKTQTLGQKERPVDCTERGAARAKSFPCSFPGPASGQGDRTWGHNKSRRGLPVPCAVLQGGPRAEELQANLLCSEGNTFPPR